MSRDRDVETETTYLVMNAIVISSSLKSRPHQQQCRSNIVECYQSNDSFDKVERCFDIVAVLATMSNRNFVLSTKSTQIEHVQFVSTLSIGRNFTKNSFDIVAKNGNNVEATFERAIFYDKLVRHCCRFGQQSCMLLRQSRTLLRHCC